MEVWQKVNLTANGTTTILAEPGKLGKVVINKVGATANTLTLYDNTAASGTVIATIDTTIAAAPTREYHCRCAVGLTAVLAAGTSADVTITFQ